MNSTEWEIVVNLPPGKFVDDLDVLFYVVHLGRFFGIEDCEG